MFVFSLKQGKIHNLEERISRECCLKASRRL
nr:MAG TPA: hypothetical protein [Caudoviricetes sp.]